MTPKYLMAIDPFEEGEEQSEFIVHNEFPKFTAYVSPISVENIGDRPEQPFHDLIYLNPEGELELFRMTLFVSEEASESEYASALSDLEHWYFKYVSETDFEECGKGGMLIRDFSNDVPGLKIIYAHGVWTLFVRGLVNDFNDEESLDSFLISDLLVPREVIDSGVINEFN